VPAQTGKRYVCAKCGAEVIVTRGGNATLYCKHGAEKIELKLKS
jgi:DNA-directed RNA polymerase subunit RPC12/RpoP